MTDYADDIRRIAKIPKEKGPLSTGKVRASIAGNSKDMLSLEENEGSIGRVVASVEVFYPNTPTETVVATSGTYDFYEADECTVTYTDGSKDEGITVTHTVDP